MQITLIDLPEDRVNLLPLTYLKSIADLRIGILTIREKWKHWLSEEPEVSTGGYLQKRYPISGGKGLLVNSAVLPDAKLVEAIQQLPVGKQLVHGDTFLAAHVDNTEDGIAATNSLPYQIMDRELAHLRHTWDFFLLNPGQIKTDFELITRDRKSQPISDPHTIVYGEDIFCDEGVTIKAAILNAEDGPIYLGRDVNIQEGSIIKGPVAMCEGSQLSLGTKVRGNITIGPYCKIGGEVSKSVIQGYSNKSHDGFLGNSVIGEWCNIGAATNNSNLKNNYGSVKMWDFGSSRFRDSGQQFCGLMMGDHSRCAINTTFNTGTTTGIMTNIFGAGFPRNYIPSFSWGGTGGFTTYKFDPALESAERAMTRRGQFFSEEERAILTHVFDVTSSDRTWEARS